MAIKLLALDLDGTVFRDDKTINPIDLDAIARIQRRGTIVTIITGRLYSGTQEVAARASIQDPVACADGCHIVDPRSHRALSLSTLTRGFVDALKGLLDDLPGVWTYALEPGRTFHPVDAPHLPYVRGWSPALTASDDIWASTADPLVLLAIGPEEAIKAAALAVRSTLNNQVTSITFPIAIMNTRGHALLMRVKGFDKGTALEWMALHHGLAMDEIAVVGDWLNDIPMLKLAGRAFAMGQAPDSIKALATDVLNATASLGGGVAEAIDKLERERQALS